MKKDQIVNYCNELLHPGEFDDYCPNGLQLDGKEDIKRIVGGVTACLELFERAAKVEADLILVHHGLIWFGAQPVFTGSYGQRLKFLFENNINLLAYHLPLDGNMEVGNAAEIGRLLNLTDIEPAIPYHGNFAGISGKTTGQTIEDIKEKWSKISTREPLIFPYGSQKIKKIAIATGGAQKEIMAAVESGADLFITGEVSEQTMHIAKEEGIHFISAGHHETEKFGVIALGQRLSSEFKIDFEFIDVYNPA